MKEGVRHPEPDWKWHYFEDKVSLYHVTHSSMRFLRPVISVDRAFSRQLGYSRPAKPKPPPPPLTDGEKEIFDKLQAKFSPAKLQVQDISGMLQGDKQRECPSFERVVQADAAHSTRSE